MVRRLSVALGLSLVLLSCSDEPAAEIVVAAPGDRVAWVGSFGALKVVLECVTPRYQQQGGQKEDVMLRDRFGLDAEEQLFRLHLFGSSEDVSQTGSVRLGDGELRSFAEAPAELGAQDRLLWQSVLQGMPVDAQQPRLRRSLVVHGRDLGANLLEKKDASWFNAEQSVVLRREVWSESARRSFFDAAVEVSDPEEQEPASEMVEPPAIDE